MALSSEDFASFCKKKGFIYASSEIYGGLAGFYDYGHLGTKLKKNFEDTWRNFFLNLSDNFHEIETANIMHQGVFKASGHLENFIDPLINCSKCDFVERADHLVEKAAKKRVEELTPNQLNKEIKALKLKCPKCKSNFKDVSVLNMMFPVKAGVGTSNMAYLRPETAQSPYVNFKLQFELLRKKLPMGLGLIGRAYRNEISPRNLTLRQREFTQAELQIFFNPNKIKEHEDFNSVKSKKLQVLLIDDRKGGKVKERTAAELVKVGLPKFYVYHLVKIQEFYLDVLNFPKAKFRLYQLNDKEKAFYNKYHFDLELNLSDHGWTEVGGLHYRTDHDLKGHEKVSKQKMEVLDEETKQRFIPHVLELSFGVDRNVYALIDLNYEDDKKRGNVVLKFPSTTAPFDCGVFSLVNKLNEETRGVYELLKYDFSCFFDTSGSVGRRYARADEVGIPYCITFDFDSKDDKAITIRDRDSTKQIRVKIADLKDTLRKLLNKEIKFEKAGKLLK